jgi:hypothetical protein
MNYLRDLFNSIISTRYTQTEVVEKLQESEVVEKSQESEVVEKLQESEVVEKSQESEVVEKSQESEVVEKSQESEVVEKLKETEVLPNIIQKNVVSNRKQKRNLVEQDRILYKEHIKRSEDLRSSIHSMNDKIESHKKMTPSKNSSTLLDTKTLCNDFNKNTKHYNKDNSSSSYEK